MRLHVLGCSGAEAPGRNLPAFLVDRTLLLDAGTIGSRGGGRSGWAHPVGANRLRSGYPFCDRIDAVAGTAKARFRLGLKRCIMF